MNHFRILVIVLFGALLLQCSESNPTAGRVDQSTGEPWHVQSPYPTSETFADVQFVDDLTAWAIAGSTLLRTRDGGATWSARYRFPNTAEGLFFVDESHGWVVGGNGMVMRTRNGGRTWSAQSSGTSTLLTAVSFADESNGWAVGSSGTILATEDGGNKWVSQHKGTDGFLRDVLFHDKRRGWVVGYSSGYDNAAEILHTKDGGLSWVHIDAGVPTDLEGSLGGIFADLCSIAAPNDQSICIVGEAIQGDYMGGITILSEDGGAHWDVVLTAASLYDVHFVSREIGWTVGYAGLFYSTSDGGRSWERVETALSGWTLGSIGFSGTQVGCAVGTYGTVLRTSDGGRTWEGVNRGSKGFMEDIFFADRDHGWAASLSNGLFRTIDGGVTWEETECNANSAVYFIDANNGWDCDFTGNLDKTSDGGITWERARDAVESRVYDMVFVNDTTGWVVGMPAILRTDNGGYTWRIQWSKGSLNAVSFVDTQHGWAVGDGGIILHTDDG